MHICNIKLNPNSSMLGILLLGATILTSPVCKNKGPLKSLLNSQRHRSNVAVAVKEDAAV